MKRIKTTLIMIIILGLTALLFSGCKDKKTDSTKASEEKDSKEYIDNFQDDEMMDSDDETMAPEEDDSDDDMDNAAHFRRRFDCTAARCGFRSGSRASPDWPGSRHCDVAGRR